jgi:hypothetical protein
MCGLILVSGVTAYIHAGGAYMVLFAMYAA